MEYYTVSEVAELLRVSEMTVRRWIWSGKLSAVRAGRSVRVHRHALGCLTQPCSDAAGPPPEPERRGSPAAVLAAIRRFELEPDSPEVAEMERIIEEGCERVDEEEPLSG